MKYKLLLLIATLFSSTFSYAQKKADKKIIKQLKADISYLASEELEGRRTASEGELKAAAYIAARYKKEKIAPYQSQYSITFPFVFGKEATDVTSLKIEGKSLKLNEEFFPLPFSASSDKTIESDVLQDMLEQESIWLMPLYASKEDADDAHFDYEKAMSEKAMLANKQRAAAIVFYDNYGAKYPPAYNHKSETATAEIPIAFLTHDAYKNYITNKNTSTNIALDINIKETSLTGTNVAAFIDNKAPYTVVIGAHYDHLGFGEMGSSTYRGKDKQIHNGADDNASGTAGLLQLASWVRSKKLRNYNYLFIHFSGEELGLLGSKAIVKQLGLDSANVAYMINMDMVGRLNDSTKALTIGGIGTSPAWGNIMEHGKKNFKIVIDSSGVGPSDHTSFYHQGIPVLFFFTGIHPDYHKPGDDADKINYEGELAVLQYVYSIVNVMDTRAKPKFTPTKQNAIGKVKFKVTLGIMPDYSYEKGNGIRVDGVSEDRPAIRAGIKAGDIIIKLGDHKITGIQTYMEALGKFKEGDSIKVKILRNKKEIELPLTFQ